ncbi:MAG: hypothetical protein AAGA80_06390 [Cyanobacteria bacterium P01_F01_bin.143]
MLRNTSPCLVKLSQPSAIALNVQLSSPNKSKRQKQKLKTLTKYVQQHSSGGKKRLELANILYETGSWTEAIAESYDYTVLTRRLENRLRLKLVLGTEGKQTKKILTALLKLAPHSANANQLKDHYYFLREESSKT